ncbi:hypothetical protein ACFY7Z_11275 [Streptomyces sp. NPDC012623]|uniref:hypothetical protein n=1 Tax=unclassified Streptomyces TaxID=2593676 RepID=UPI0036737F31
MTRVVQHSESSARGGGAACARTAEQTANAEQTVNAQRTVNAEQTANPEQTANAQQTANPEQTVNAQRTVNPRIAEPLTVRTARRADGHVYAR